MNKPLLPTIAVGFVLVTILSASPASGQTSGRHPLDSADSAVVQSCNEFGFKIFKEIVREDKDSTIFISPYSVSIALAMVYNGSNGATREAIAKTLEVTRLRIDEVNQSLRNLSELFPTIDPKVTFKIANSIWHSEDPPVKPAFVELNKSCFNAEVSAVNFADPNTIKIINDWVERSTNGKIKDMVRPPLNPMTAMILIDAIYFKGDWSLRFDTLQTRDDSFTAYDGAKAPCKLMHRDDVFPYFENDEFQCIELPYGDKLFSMVILLPKPEIDIDSLTERLSADAWNDWRSRLRMKKGEIFLPRFRLEYTKELNDALTAMGMGIAFTHSANFDEMVERGPVWIDEVLHKSFVQVDEKGTEAAAATSIGMATTAAPPSPGFVMRVDRPFLFLIQAANSGMVLFAGKMTRLSII
jgi:serpin B